MNQNLKRLGLIVVMVAAAMWVFRPDSGPRFGSIRAAADRKPMPEFRYPLLSGQYWSVAEQKGKIVFVNFWATWCGPCREETPALVEVYTHYRSRGVEFVGISLDEQAGKVVPPFLQRYQVNYPIAVPDGSSAIADAIESLPTSFLLDRQGRVARTWIGAVHAEDLSANIEQLLAEPAVN
jgi:thiol-disulfide isomerase/thioredoxin